MDDPLLSRYNLAYCFCEESKIWLCVELMSVLGIAGYAVAKRRRLIALRKKDCFYNTELF